MTPQQIKAMVSIASHIIGKCDRCNTDSVMLWDDPPIPGFAVDWKYCRECWLAVADNRECIAMTPKQLRNYLTNKRENNDYRA